MPDGLHKLKYAFLVADVVHFVCTHENLAIVNQMAQIIDLRNSATEK